MANKVKVKNPHGIVVIYNYRERFGDSYVSSDPFEIDEIILNSASLISVQTQKSKSSPGGSFEIRLAPYKNWTSAITPGSWCIILMSNSTINDSAKYGGSKVNENSFKMLGRIESVRGVVNTNQSDGSISKQYIVTGSDWGAIFDNALYVDPLDRDPDATPMGMAQRFGYGTYLEQVTNWTQGVTKDSSKKEPTPKKYSDIGDLLNGEGTSKPTEIKNKTVDQLQSKTIEQLRAEVKQSQSEIDAGAQARQKEFEQTTTPIDRSSAIDKSSDSAPTASRNIRVLLELWGKVGNGYLKTNDATDGRLLGDAQQQFRIPKELASYMGFVSQNVADILDTYSGTGALVGEDTYSGYDPSIGIIRFDSIFGENSMWSVLTSNMNRVTSELIPEVRFKNGKASLTLYNRVKPFVINKNNMKKDAFKIGDAGETRKVANILDEVASEFKNVRTIDIDYNDVILSSFGTNWRDKVNFVEITLGNSLMFGQNYAASLKLDSQFYDKKSISRDGLRSVKLSTDYVPINDNGFADPLAINAYKYLMKEWYFNTHHMLNGTLSLVGQDKYIQVGDNIKVNAKVLDINRNFNLGQSNSDKAVYLLAHVESISHNISYDGDYRVFTTSINFVRGILVNNSKVSLNELNSGALDQDAKLITPGREVNSRMSASSSSTDPDRQKLGSEPGIINAIREDSDDAGS